MRVRGLLEQDEHVPWTHLVIFLGQHMERRSLDYDFNRFLPYFFHLGIFWICDTSLCENPVISVLVILNSLPFLYVIKRDISGTLPPIVVL